MDDCEAQANTSDILCPVTSFQNWCNDSLLYINDTLETPAFFSHRYRVVGTVFQVLLQGEASQEVTQYIENTNIRIFSLTK